MRRSSRFQIVGTALADVLADQAVGTCGRHSYLNVLSQKLSLRRNEIQNAIAGCVTRPLILPAGLAFHENLEGLAHERGVTFALNLSLIFLENHQPPPLFLFRDRVG